MGAGSYGLGVVITIKVNLDDPSYWCRRTESSLRDIARSIRRVEELVIEADIRPEGEMKAKAKRNARVYHQMCVRSVAKLQEVLEELEKRLPS